MAVEEKPDECEPPAPKKKKKEKLDTALGDMTDVNGNMKKTSHSTEGLNGDSTEDQIVVVKV